MGSKRASGRGERSPKHKKKRRLSAREMREKLQNSF